MEKEKRMQEDKNDRATDKGCAYERDRLIYIFYLQLKDLLIYTLHIAQNVFSNCIYTQLHLQLCDKFKYSI